MSKIDTHFRRIKDLPSTHLLGTGTPVADPERMGPCTAIIVDDQDTLHGLMRFLVPGPCRARSI